MARKILAIAAAVALVVGLWWCYWRLSWTVAATSDGAAQALQAQDILHGNLLLRGWQLSDVSFYTTELPEYVLIESVRRLSTGTIHIAAALTYTLLVLMAALVGRGRARGREGLIRALVAAGIMLAPQLGNGAFVLLLSPDHVGTQVPLLAGWLLLDRAPRRWYVPVAMGLLLAWVQVADSVALLTAVIPLILVCCWRAGRAGTRWREHVFELAVAAAAVVSVGVAKAAERLLARAGGFQSGGVAYDFSPHLAAHLKIAGTDIMFLYGAEFSRASGWLGAFFAAVHLIGLLLAAVGFLFALGRCLRAREGTDLVSGVLAVAIVLNLAAYVSTTDPTSDPYMAREIAAVLPLGAVLAAREIRWRAPGARAQAAGQGGAGRSGKMAVYCGGLAAVLGCYAAALGYGAAQPAVPGGGAELAAWLSAHHLTDGLATAVSNIATVDSGGRVQFDVVSFGGGRVVERHFQSAASWYDPQRHKATFLALDPQVDGTNTSAQLAAAEATFGTPKRLYHVGDYTVITWNKNLLASLRRGLRGGCRLPFRSASAVAGFLSAPARRLPALLVISSRRGFLGRPAGGAGDHEAQYEPGTRQPVASWPRLRHRGRRGRRPSIRRPCVGIWRIAGPLGAPCAEPAH